MSIDSRLARLAPSLTAQERAILILEAWKDDRPEDPSWRRSMPPEQSSAFNRYIDLINTANPILGHLITALYHQARELELREVWMIDLTLWQEHVDEIREAVRLAVEEPITQSDYEAKLVAAREEWVPVEEIAAFLAGYRDDWTEDDYEETEDGRQLSDAAWERAVADEVKGLRKLVSDGTLPSRGRGKAMKLRSDAVCHFGHEVDAAPEDYLSYRVLPDEQSEAIDVERGRLQRLQDALDRTDGTAEDEEFRVLPEEIRTRVGESMASGLIAPWVELRCVDAVLNEIGEQFNGIDPLRPVLREKLETTRQKLLTLKEHLLVFGMDVVLREPAEEELEEIREFIASIPTPN